MDALVQYICEHIYLAPYVFFVLLLLAGLNIPISEDVLLITGGMISATCAPPGYTAYIYAGLYIGCIVSGWEAYWLGRLLGPKLYRIRWIAYLIHPGRVEKLNHYYEKYGIWTFFVVRFIPGGVRNAFFMTAGLGRMPFSKFMIRDALAAIVSTNVVFYLGYFFAAHYETLVHYFKRYNLIVIAIIVILAVVLGVFFYIHRKRER